jgi:hypothetical protein
MKKEPLNLDEWLLMFSKGNVFYLLNMDGMSSAIVSVYPKYTTGAVYETNHRKAINAVDKVPPFIDVFKRTEASEEQKHELMRSYLRRYKYAVWYEGPADIGVFTDITVSTDLVLAYIRTLERK